MAVLISLSYSVCVNVFTNSFARNLSIKQSVIGLNSQFSFSQTSCHAKTKEPSLSLPRSISFQRIVTL